MTLDPVAADFDLLACELCGLVSDGRARSDVEVVACNRCGTALRARKHHAMSRSAAYLIAALVLYIPANVLPVMYTKMLGEEASSTIVGGIIEFFESGSWDIALLIFLASVAVPCAKFISLTILLMDRRHGRTSKIHRTKLLKFVEAIGYWSMLDVLVVAVVTALIQFKALGTAEPQSGIVFFGAVVVLTMLSAMSFDGRQTWED